jgi:cytochrome d ubiquinol oxidase subunit II
MSVDLPLIWAALIAFAVLAYVVLDGFDLGVGILFAVERADKDRDMMVNSVAPIWDGNETWLVLGGGGLFAMFPLAYATIMPALYPVIIAMLLALVFRGVAFEFRFRAASRGGRYFWDLAFSLGSAIAALCQGLALGGLLQGVKVENRAYAGGWWDWLTPFTILCGLAVVAGYALLGACWLIWRTEGPFQARCRRRAGMLGILVLACIGAVSLWTPFLNGGFFERWFGWPGVALTAPVPALVALLAFGFWRGLAARSDAAPFFCTLGWFVLCFAGLGISMYPLIVPPSLSIWQAAAPPASQGFLLAGAVVLLPIILAYTAYGHWLFRGKIGHDAHYH